MDGLCVLVCFLAATLEHVSGSGKIEVRLLEFENADGTGDNGNPCDGMFGIARSECDHYFRMCIDDATGDSSMTSCSVGLVETGKVHNVNSITFTDDIGGTPNPLLFNFTRWNSGGIKIKVDVWDHDNSNDHDHVEKLPSRTVTSAPYTQEAGATEQDVIISGRTSLTVRVKVYCDVYYYGLGCGVFCRPQNSDTRGHYDCSPDGARQCHPGWEGVQCDEQNQCFSSPCQNGGSCQGGPNWFSCLCPWPYSGGECTVNDDPCLTSPCGQSGTCNSSKDGYECICKSGYTGEQCQLKEEEEQGEEVTDPCLSSPCEDNEDCTAAPPGYSCTPSSGNLRSVPTAALVFVLSMLAIKLSL